MLSPFLITSLVVQAQGARLSGNESPASFPVTSISVEEQPQNLVTNLLIEELKSRIYFQFARSPELISKESLYAT